MAETVTGGVARLSQEDVNRVCGDLLDWKVSAILSTDATIDELEAAVAWLEGQDDVMGEERRALTGTSEQIYDILVADEEFAGEDRSR